MGSRTTSALRAERERDADVALDEVADVGDVVAGHQRPLEPHAEREAAVAVGVHAGRLEDDWVDHAAAAPLDPAFGPAGAAAGRAGLRRFPVTDPAEQVDLGRRLGEREV